MASHITITPVGGPVTVKAGADILGQSLKAVEMKEGSYPPVLYVPRADMDMAKLHRTDRATTCPHKGQASYFSVQTPTGMLENVVWSYESPKADMSAIAGHLAFYTDRVSVTRG